MFFSNLLKWVKDHGKLILTIISIVVAIFGGIQSIRANRWEREAARLDGKLQEQIADQDLLYGEAAKLRAEHRIEEAAEKQVRKDLEARIQKFQKDTIAGKRALREEKEKTVTLPATELVMQINERIGDESSLTGAGLFLFTRLGTNNTLDRFKSGEFYLSLYNKQLKTIGDHEKKATSFATSLAKCEKAVAKNLEGWDDCRETLATAMTDIVVLEKGKKSSVWRGRKQGAFWTIIIAGGLKLAGVW